MSKTLQGHRTKTKQKGQKRRQMDGIGHFTLECFVNAQYNTIMIPNAPCVTEAFGGAHTVRAERKTSTVSTHNFNVRNNVSY